MRPPIVAVIFTRCDIHPEHNHRRLVTSAKDVSLVSVQTKLAYSNASFTLKAVLFRHTAHFLVIESVMPGAIGQPASRGGIGGFALTIICDGTGVLDVPTMASRTRIGGAGKLFDASGKLVNDGTQKFLEGFMKAYALPMRISFDVLKFRSNRSGPRD